MRTDEIKRIAVVGAGLMGHGIAQEFAVAGYQLYLHDLSDKILQEALENITRNLRMLVGMELATEEQVESVPGRIHCSTSLQEVAGAVDLVVEAVSEDLSIKREVFAELDRMCPEHAILASNSSSFMPSQVASVTKRADKVVVTHYFNPPYLLPLVEIVRGKDTSDETVSTVHDLMTMVGKRPVVVKKEVPGFVGNRLQMALIRECLSIVEQGIASAEEVDLVVKSSFGRRLAAAGPFELFDIGGWDILYGISYLFAEIDASPDVPRLMKERVEKSELGVKTGKGFYQWTPEKAEAARRRIAQALVAIERLSQEM